MYRIQNVSPMLLMHIISLACECRENRSLLPLPPALSLYFSLSSSFGRKIVPPKWSARQFSEWSCITAYRSTRGFSIGAGKPRSEKEYTYTRSLFDTLPSESPRDFLGRIDYSAATTSVDLWTLFRLLHRDLSSEERKLEISVRGICSVEKGKCPHRVRVSKALEGTN